MKHGGKSVIMHATAYCDIRTAGSTPATTAKQVTSLPIKFHNFSGQKGCSIILSYFIRFQGMRPQSVNVLK